MVVEGEEKEKGRDGGGFERGTRGKEKRKKGKKEKRVSDSIRSIH